MKDKELIQIALMLTPVVVKKDAAFLEFKNFQVSFVIFTVSGLNSHKSLFAPRANMAPFLHSCF
jgi:hypothetical protein